MVRCFEPKSKLGSDTTWQFQASSGDIEDVFTFYIHHTRGDILIDLTVRIGTTADV